MSNYEIIKKAYYDPQVGFVGAKKLYEKLKFQGIYQKEIEDFLKKQEIAQITRRNNRSGSFIADGPLDEFQIDLIYIENKHLNEHSYGLCCIDVFTKKADVELMKKKTSKNTSEAMEIILSRMGLPKAVYCDEGTEFTSHEFKKLMEKNKIRLIFTLTHAPVVERFNRTLKEMLNKYLIVSKSKTITNILPKILENYNNSYHSSIGMSPNNVNKNNEHIVWKNLFRKAKKMTIRSLTIGDHVRVMLKEKSNIKKHKPRYSKTVHTITDIKDGLVSVNNNDRKYLKAHVMKVSEPESHEIEPDISGTREGHLKELAVTEAEPQVVPISKPIAQTKQKREIQKPARYRNN